MAAKFANAGSKVVSRELNAVNCISDSTPLPETDLLAKSMTQAFDSWIRTNFCLYYSSNRRLQR
jgi:hypothetical protein